MTGSIGVSSTLRPFDSIIDVPEYWIARSRGCETYLRPHPEERAPCARLEGWPRVPALRPSFETLASQAPQDEVRILRGRRRLRVGRAHILQTHLHGLAAQCARAVDKSSAQTGRGERRMPNAPAASCAMIVVERTRVTTSTPESPGIPA